MVHLVCLVPVYRCFHLVIDVVYVGLFQGRGPGLSLRPGLRLLGADLGRHVVYGILFILLLSACFGSHVVNAILFVFKENSILNISGYCFDMDIVI